MGQKLLRLWSKLSRLPWLGPKLFSLYLGVLVPYSGSIRAQVVKLERGEVEIQMPDLPDLRNHLSSLHAIALANLAEFSSGLAVITSLDEKQRAILVKMEAVYKKKARGKIRAVSQFQSSGQAEEVVEAHLYDSAGDEVVCFHATWKIS